MNLYELHVKIWNYFFQIRDYYFATLAFPIGQFVGIIFWTLWHINRELVFPKAFDSIFPSYINHLMHTVVIPGNDIIDT